MKLFPDASSVVDTIPNAGEDNEEKVEAEAETCTLLHPGQVDGPQELRH